MHICTGTFRTLSRARKPLPSLSSNTLLPFLYQTPTIQQWKTVTPPISRRTVAYRSKQTHDVPFENAHSLSPSIADAASTPARKTTITGPERAAFEKLCQKVGREPQRKSDIPFAPDDDRIVDEYYEDEGDGDTDAESIDSIFDAVLSGAPPPRRQNPGSAKPKKQADYLQTLTENILKPETEKARKKTREGAKVEAQRIKSIREAERVRVNKLMEDARTDRELWQVLEKEVFSIVRVLDLDGMKKAVQEEAAAAEAQFKKRRKNSKTSSAESTTSPVPADLLSTRQPFVNPRMLFPNYPVHLVNAVRILRSSFPSSPLPLTILPAIKSLGRSSYALGATTQLYNRLIGAAWRQYGSYTHVHELLSDMENGGIAFDATTLTILQAINNEVSCARRGAYGELVRGVWNMEQTRESAGKLEEWRKLIRQRLGTVSDVKRKEGKLVRYHAGEWSKDGVDEKVGPGGESDQAALGMEAAASDTELSRREWTPNRYIEKEQGEVNTETEGSSSSGHDERSKANGEGHESSETRL